MIRLVLILILFVLPAYGAATNILMIVFDDMRPAGGYTGGQADDFMAFAIPDSGTRSAWNVNMTPNLDALTADSVYFSRCYASNPLCNPSRTSFLTGRNPWPTNPELGNLSWFRGFTSPLFSDAETIPEYLRRRGYQTYGTGKVFHRISGAYPKTDEPRSWDSYWSRSITPTVGTTNLYNYEDTGTWAEFGTHSGGAAWTNHHEYATCLAVSNLLASGTATLNDQEAAADETITILPSKPFFIAVGIYAPHAPHFIPSDILDLFSTNDLTGLTASTLAAVSNDVSDLSALAFNESREGTLARAEWQEMIAAGITKSGAGGDVAAWKEHTRHYLADVAIADRLAGMVLDGLYAGSYSNSTTVVVLSDNGYHLGEKFHLAKETPYEIGCKVPLWIKDPDNSGQWGNACTQFVGLIDLYPTILAQTTLPARDELAGFDLSAYLADTTAAAVRTLSYSEAGPNYPIRRDAYTYVAYDGTNTDSELYLATDARQLTNQIDVAAHASIQAEGWADFQRVTTRPYWWNEVPTTGRAGPRVEP